GALKVFDYKAGVLGNKVSVAPNGGKDFGPRHLDFHPTKPWVYAAGKLAAFLRQTSERELEASWQSIPPCRPARTPTRPASSSPARTLTGTVMCLLINPPDMRRPNRPAPLSRRTASTRPIALSRRSTTAAIWWRPRSGWSTRMSPTTKCTLHAARSLELNRWRRFTSRAAFITSARSRRLRISSACSRRILTVRLRGFSPDRVDALVWALTDLLVEPMPGEGHFEYMRQQAAALKKPLPEPPKPVYTIGSMEWAAQQAEKGE